VKWKFEVCGSIGKNENGGMEENRDPASLSLLKLLTLWNDTIALGWIETLGF